MKTTLRELRKYNLHGLDKLMKSLGTEDLDTEVSILEILNICGIEDASWALGIYPYKDVCLFLADVAESVLYLFEDKFPDDKRPKIAIEGIRLYHAGKITEGDLRILRWGVQSSVEDANYDTIYDVEIAAACAAEVVFYATDGNYIRFSTAASEVVHCSYNTGGGYEIDKTLSKHVEPLLRKFLNKNLLDDDLFKI